MMDNVAKYPVIAEATEAIRNGLRRAYPVMAARYNEVLPYHGAPHALDVTESGLLLAAEEGVTDERELELLVIATIWHDFGFVIMYEDNEWLGAGATRKCMLRRGGYSEMEIRRVMNCVMSTRVDMSNGFVQLIVDPRDPLQRIIADADVANFGRGDAEEKSELVWQEMIGLGKLRDDVETRAEFELFRARIVAAHRWQTAAARRLWGGGR